MRPGFARSHQLEMKKDHKLLYGTSRRVREPGFPLQTAHLVVPCEAEWEPRFACVREDGRGDEDFSLGQMEKSDSPWY